MYDRRCQGRYGVRGLPCRLAPSLKSRTAGFFNAWPGMGKNIVMWLCPVPPLRNEDARHVLRDGTVLSRSAFAERGCSSRITLRHRI
jgi:hypothetical protein